MAVFDIHELKANSRGIQRGMNEVFNETGDLIIAENGRIVFDTHAAIEERMPVGDAWFGKVMPVGTAESSRVSQLESHIKVIRRTALFRMSLLQLAQQVLKGLKRVILKQELVRICAAIMTDRDRFPAPDQLSATQTKMTPPPECELRGKSLWSPIPPLHRVDCPTVSDLATGIVNGLCQRRLWSALNLVITGKIQIERGEPFSELPGSLERRNPWKGLFHQAFAIALKMLGSR
jgi:hypothetical protein